MRNFLPKKLYFIMLEYVIYARMSKKKILSTIFLKDFHGGSISFDLPLPSETGLYVHFAYTIIWLSPFACDLLFPVDNGFEVFYFYFL